MIQTKDCKGGTSNCISFKEIQEEGFLNLKNRWWGKYSVATTCIQIFNLPNCIDNYN